MDPGVRRDDGTRGRTVCTPRIVIPAEAGIQTRYRLDAITSGSGYGFPPSRE